MSGALLSPARLGPLTLANRMVMAPMTRTRAGEDGVPTALMARYYAQRASAGLIVTECVSVAPESAGIIRAPGLYTEAQAEGWRPVVDAVHEAGGRIFAQLWHCGRASHVSLQPDGSAPIAPSPIAAEGMIFTPEGRKPFSTPRELTTQEIAAIVRAFAAATRRARDAGFDGVELHGAFGYLVDQFLQDGSNHRTDAYGGSVENRTRFLFEVVDAMAAAWTPDRIGVKLSPSNRFYGMFDSDPAATFGRAVEGLGERGVLYVHFMEPNEGDLATGTVQLGEVAKAFHCRFPGAVIANGGFDRDRAEAFLKTGLAEFVSFGRPFIANPDLPARYAAGARLNEPDPATFYGEGPEGYVDYPTMLEAAAKTRDDVGELLEPAR